MICCRSSGRESERLAGISVNRVIIGDIVHDRAWKIKLFPAGAAERQQRG
jgi:hypothetical protein